MLTLKKDEIEKHKTILECIQASNKYSDPSSKRKGRAIISGYVHFTMIDNLF
jgi:hypothetical protein